jgi:two-component system chemotaxis sensor kinase CheA
VNAALLELEQGDPSREPVDAIFRGVHTIKGMSATMGYTAVAEFSHELESLLEKVRDGEQGISADLMDALFAAADALEDGVDRAQEGLAMSDAMQRALERLHDVAGGRSTAEFRVMRASGAMAAAVAGAAGAAPGGNVEGPGTIVEVIQEAQAMLPGVRAFMATQRLRELGEILGCDPTVEKLQVATTPQHFRVRLKTTAGASEIERAVRSAGDVATVRIEERMVATPGVAPIVERISAPLPAPGPAAPAEVPAHQPRARHVRIELARLDTLLNLVGELVIVRGRLQALTAQQGSAALEEAMVAASGLISELQREIMTSRLVPVGQVFDRFPRLVRDAARQLGKDVLFSIEGKEIEMDRSVLDEIGEPVVHLLRNAVDHGLELPEERVAAGKPRAGRLVLSAHRDRTAVAITVKDDGKGIDRQTVLARAIATGLVGAATTQLDDDTLLQCIAQPGFSTSAAITGISGRGVGVDAVIARTRALGGSVELQSHPGVGTTLVLRLPMTLAIVRALLARVGNERYALPLTHVRETLERGPAEVRPVQGREMLVLRDEVLPLLRLREVVALQGGAAAGAEEIVIIERGDRRVGLVVDELTGQEDIVVKSFDAAQGGLALFSGATILADGAPALIVDVGSLV